MGADTILSRSGVLQITLSRTSDAYLTIVVNDSNGLIIAEKTNPNFQFLLGGWGSVQSIKQETGYLPLLLSPNE